MSHRSKGPTGLARVVAVCMILGIWYAAEPVCLGYGEREKMAADDVPGGQVAGSSGSGHAGTRKEAPAASDENSALQKQLERAFGIQVAADGDRYLMELVDGHKVQELFSCERTAAGLKESAARLRSMVREKEQEIENKFRVRIAEEGETTCQSSSSSDVSDVWVGVRHPSLYELVVLERALRRSNPSYLMGKSPDSKGINVYFLKDIRILQAAADWGYDHKRQPAIFIEPNIEHWLKRVGKKQTGDAAAGEPAKASAAKEKAGSDGEDEEDDDRLRTLEAVLVHELAHNADFKTGWASDKKLGWVYFWSLRTGLFGWATKTRERPARLFRQSVHTKRWVRCDASGELLKADGTKARREVEAQTISASEMRKNALVRPATSYCPNPHEVFAEGLTLYRMGKESRERLRATSPELYEIIKAADQAEIDRTYGKGRYVRGEDGFLVETSTRSAATAR